MPFAIRTALMISTAVGLAACATNPSAPDRAPVEFRGASPVSRPAPPKPVASSTRAPVPSIPSAAVPAPRVVDLGPSSATLSATEEAQALPAETGLRPGGPLKQPKDNPSARRLQVTGSDTLYDISRRYNVNMRALIETNHLEPPYALDRGSVVYLPPPNVHAVERGETLYSISRRYNVDTRSLALLNNMSRPWTVWPGDELVLPPLARDQQRQQVRAPQPITAAPPVKTAAAATQSTIKPPSVKPSAIKPAPVKPPVAIAKTDAPISPKPAPAKPASKPAPAPEQYADDSGVDRDFIWPVSGQVLKGFGSGDDGQRNDGVNISVPAGTPVKAAAAGEVVYAGSELVGFGNLILIRHPGGWISAYAHSERLLVKEGDVVRQGQPIAEAGQTGNASSPQVHFELRKGKEPVDPSLHLPPLRG